MPFFPLLNDSPSPDTAASLPLAREFARDPETGRTIWVSGKPVIVTGAAAVRSWAFAALATVRCRFPIYDADFGCEVEWLIGRKFDQQVKAVEASRMICDALTISPYVTGVRDVSVIFQGTTLCVACTIETIYGEEEIHERL